MSVMKPALSLLCYDKDQGCTTHNPRVGSGPRMCFIRPSQQVKRYKKLQMNDGDLIKELINTL